jgi:class 3 adenylate cyclase
LETETFLQPEDWLKAIRHFEHAGELFRAYDLARRALDRFPDNLQLKQRAVLCLASTGATGKAAEALTELGLDQPIAVDSQLGLDIACLRPRLMKDATLCAVGEQRRADAAVAADAYQEVYVRAVNAKNHEAYYAGVNAATLNLLAGRKEEAVALARDVLNLLRQGPRDQQNYYELASEIEMRLILGDVTQARGLAQKLRSFFQGEIDYRALSSTVRQLRLIVEAERLSDQWQDALSPPRVIHYLGHIIARPGVPGRFPAEEEPSIREAIDQVLAAEDVGFGYGALAAGADILFAEALLDRNAKLHVVLPFNREEFVDVSVRPAGEQWVERFERCFHRATVVRYATEDRYLGDDHLFGYCSQLAMGLALLSAHHLSTSVEQIVVWDGKSPTGPGGTAADMAVWRLTRMPQRVIPVGSGFSPPRRAPVPAAERRIERRTYAMLFSDIHGFSKLTDEQLPRFITYILGRFAEIIKKFSTYILLKNTWGDGLFVVFNDIGQAANCALELQEIMNTFNLEEIGLPRELALRVGIHLGPVYAASDPILERQNFFGAHVSRTARVEPVTPEGCVYVTEPMAAILMLRNAGKFTCQYVGMTEAAKHYGEMRMFLLGRRAQ